MMSGCFVLVGHRRSSVCRKAMRCRRCRHSDGRRYFPCSTPPAEVPSLSNAKMIVTASHRYSLLSKDAVGLFLSLSSCDGGTVARSSCVQVLRGTRTSDALPDCYRQSARVQTT
eukprot:scaffold95411_cov19-Prasinocladus_malaysianus.AAC.1